MGELYELPEGWEWQEWKSIVNVRNGKHYKEVLNPNGKYPIYGSGGIMNYADEYLCNENTTIIGRKGTINSPIFVKEKFWNIDTAFGLEAKEEYLIPLYLYYFALHFDFLILNKSTTLPSLAKSNLQKILMPLPPLQEQKRIVAKLDSLFAKIDQAIALHQQNIAEAEGFMGSVLNEVFGELEGQYEKKELKDIVDNHDGKRIPIKASDRENIQGEYPYYGASGIIDYVEDYIFDGEYLLISEDGANLTVRKYPIAFIARGKFWVNNHAHIVLAKKEVSSNKYMEYSFAYTDISSYITGSAQPKMSQKKMNIIQFVIPPLETQQKTVQYLDQISQKTEKLKQAQQEKIQSLKELKASLLDRAFRGELLVSLY